MFLVHPPECFARVVWAVVFVSLAGNVRGASPSRVDDLVVDFDSPKIITQWEEIMNRINSGDMPPESEPRPKPEDVASAADRIACELRVNEQTRVWRYAQAVSLDDVREGEVLRGTSPANFPAGLRPVRTSG